MDIIEEKFPHYDPAGKELVRKAYQIASRVLAEDKRSDGSPFIGHPMGVALIASDEIALPAACVAAVFLHETLRMHPDELYAELCREFYNPSAAFPAIMDQTIRKSIVELYNKVPTTFQAFTTKGTLRDFKSTPDHEYVIGGVGDFLKVPENGEIKPDMPQTQLLPSRKLDTYGKQFSMTRQAFINDDIGFLTEVPGLYATAAKKTIDKQVYGILFNNPAIFDGTALFHASHNNLIGSGAAGYASVS